MKARGNVLLLGVLTVLCAAYWLMRETEQRQITAKEEAKKVFSFKPEDIQRLTVHRKDETPVVGVRGEDGGWTVTEPIHSVGSRPVWSRVAAGIANLASERTLDLARDDHALYGLDDPRLTLHAELIGGKTITLAFGDAEPTQQKRFVLIDDQQVILARNAAFIDMDRPLLDLRDRFLVRTAGENEGVTRIAYTRIKKRTEADGPPDPDAPPEMKNGVPQATVVLERENGGKWQMTEPVKCLANQDAAIELAVALQTSAGEDFVDQPANLADYGLDPPGARIVADVEGWAEPQIVYLGGVYKKTKDSPEMVYVKRENAPEVFLVNSYILQTVPTSPLAFRERRLLTRGAKGLDKVEYTMSDRRFVFEYTEETGWRVTHPALPDSDQTAISNFIGQIASTYGQHFPGTIEPEFGFDNPVLRIVLHYGEDNATSEIVVGSVMEDGTGRFAMQDIGIATTIPVTAYNQLVRSEWDFRDRRLFKHATKDVTEIRFAVDGTNYVLRKDETGMWRVLQPEGMRLESQGDAGILLDAAANATAVKLEAREIPADLAPHGLDAPSATLTMVTANATFGPLSIGNAAPDNDQQRFATMQGRAELYRVDQLLVSDLREAVKGIVQQQ